MSKIQEHLKDEGLIISKKSLCLLIRKQKLTGLIANNKKVRKRQKKLTEEHYTCKFIDAVMAKLSASKLSASLPSTYM